MARRLSFFYRRRQLSGEIRRQVAERIGARVNPETDYENDVGILVKMLPGQLLKRGVTRLGVSYLDFLDHSTCLRWLQHRPEFRLIMASQSGLKWLSERFPNPMTFIPQHHCNLGHLQRPHRPIRVVGYVGMMPYKPDWYEPIDRGVRRMGLDMRWFTDYQTREDVVDAYQQIDIQFAWREGMPEKLLHLKNPLKVINGASFGIPTVAKGEPSYDQECEGRYYRCETITEALDQIAALKDGWDEQVWTDGRLQALAAPYHIDRIGAMYRRLADA